MSAFEAPSHPLTLFVLCAVAILATAGRGSAACWVPSLEEQRTGECETAGDAARRPRRSAVPHSNAR